MKLRHDSLGQGIAFGSIRGEFVWGYSILELIAIDAFMTISDNYLQHLARLKRERLFSSSKNVLLYFLLGGTPGLRIPCKCICHASRRGTLWSTGFMELQ